MEFLRKDYGKVWANSGELISPSSTKIDSGWVLEMMPYQWENWLTNRQDEAISYILQKGVPEYLATQEYIANKSVVSYNGNLYTATSNVIGILPTVTSSWKRLNPISDANGVISLLGGGTGATSAPAARANLGLGSLSLQESSSASITGGSINGTTIGIGNPSTAVFTTVTATSVTGALIGNASTASSLQTPRTIALSGAVTGSPTNFNGASNITIPVTAIDSSFLTGTSPINITGNATTATRLETGRTLTIGSTGKSFNGSSNISWSLLEIGAAPENHTHALATNSTPGFMSQQDKQSLGKVIEDVSKSVLSFPDYAAASAAAATLPDGQQVEAPDADGELFTYVVSAGALGSPKEFDLVYKQSAPSSVPRTAKQYFRENWTIRDFGNPGYGGDWTSVFQKIASEVDPGQHIKLLDDLYYIEDNVTFSRDGLKFTAYGPSHTVIKRAPGLAADVGSMIFQGCKDIQLAGFTLDGDITNQVNVGSGLILASAGGGVEGVEIDNLVLKNWGQSSMANFSAGLAAYSAKRLRISRSYATGNAHYGFNFFECTDVVANALYSIGNGSHGFGAAGMRDFNFSACHSRDNRIQGFWFRNVEDGTLAACTATWSTPSSEFVRRGLQLKGTASAQEASGNNRVRNIAVEGFVCRGALDTLTATSESAGIYMQFESGGSISGVNFQGGVIDECGFGALLLNGEHIYIDGTVIRNPRNIGVKDDGVNHFGYTNVRVVDGYKQGIVSRGRYGDITGNKVRSRQLDATNTYSAIEYADRSDVTISDNEASSLEGTNAFRSAVHLSGAFSTRVRTFENRIKSTASPVTKSADFGSSGTGNADWDNFNNTGLSPYADKRFAGVVHVGDGYNETMPGVFSGTGSPEGVVTARVGSLYLRRDGGTGTSQYSKESGTGNTGWVAK